MIMQPEAKYIDLLCAKAFSHIIPEIRGNI